MIWAFAPWPRGEDPALVSIQSGRSAGRRSIRYPILAIAWIPSLVLLVIGLVDAGALAYEGAAMRRHNDQFNGTSRSAAEFMKAVFTERRLSEAAAVDPAANTGELTSTRGQVDRALPAFLVDV